MSKKKIMSGWNKFFIIVMLIAIVLMLFFKNYKPEFGEIRSIKSEKELMNIYKNNGDDSLLKKVFLYSLALPIMPFEMISSYNSYGILDKGTSGYDYSETNALFDGSSWATSMSSEYVTKDYSKTNTQVENVDEADIIKTDGDYIYSLSDENIVITDVKDPQNIKVTKKINSINDYNPEDLILYKNKLIAIYSNVKSYRSDSETIVKIFNIENKYQPVIEKEYTLFEPYYTSRCINNMLYVISSGYLREEDDKVLRKYTEDGEDKEIALEDIKYIKDNKTKDQTLISSVDLDQINEKINVESYLMDVSNAYVSEKSIYLVENDYDYKNKKKKLPLKDLFGKGGIIGFILNYDDTYDYGYYSYDQKTKVFKFNINSSGNINYVGKNELNGRTINQYSMDEKNNHLRIALYDNDGTRIVILDDKLNQIGETEKLAKGEKMYTSRFINNKAYLVTYKTIDPLFVVDLSNESKPKVLGKLKIPGYSTYLHPYDENHLIGIGRETKETTYRDDDGKVLSTTARNAGMKMALFDVSNVNNPIQISQTIIGDSTTTSAILTNPKALLFSKEKELIAIPVNRYSETSDLIEEDDYAKYYSSYYDDNIISEGYLVYKINIEDGFNLKGIITHDKNKRNKSSYYYGNNSRLLRGLYIDDNLYTVSEDCIKVNNLETLELVNEVKI